MLALESSAFASILHDPVQSTISTSAARPIGGERVAPGRVTLVGKPGEGKSFLTTDMAQCHAQRRHG